MLRRNFDFLAIAFACLAMFVIGHVPPPSAAVDVIRFQNAVRHDPCPLLARILSRLH